MTCAVVATGIGAYITELLSISEQYSPIWWILFYSIFNFLNIVGVQLSFKLQVYFTVLSVLFLLIFYIGAIPMFDFDKYVVQTGWILPLGYAGNFQK